MKRFRTTTMLHRKGLSEAVTTPGSTVWTFGDIDDLSLSYSGNQLKKAADRADGLTYADAMDFKDGADRAEEYTYDANGNMTSDRNRGLHSIAYNVLNLPQAVRFADGHETRYTYDADGRKLRVEHLLNNVAVIDGEPGARAGSLRASGSRAARAPDTGGGTGIEPPVRTLTTRDYCADHIYCNGTLERVLNEVGYSDSAGYHYYVRDYRGDVRAVVADDGTLEEVNSYYPYGMLHGPSAIAAGVQPLKYGAKELDRQAGADLYNSRARQLDPLLGRTTTQDPMVEKYYSISPYAWCASNPVRFIDFSGMYFNPTDSIQADEYIDRLNQRITELGYSNVEDRNEQLAEVNKSLQDIEDMRNDAERRYTFEEGYIEPEVLLLESKTVLIRIDKGKKGSFAHEIRHGGQIARNEWSFENGIPDNRYGSTHEVSAYRAEFSAVGFMSNDCWIELFQMPMSVSTKLIKQIDKNYLELLFQKNKGYLYRDFGNDWYKK